MARNNRKSGTKTPSKRSKAGGNGGWAEEEVAKRRRAKELMDPASATEDGEIWEKPAKPAKAKKQKAKPDKPKKEEPEEEYYEEEERRGFRIPWFRWFFNLTLTFGLMGVCVLVSILLYYTKDLPSTDLLYAGPSSPPITIIARDGTTLGTLGGFHGKPLKFEEFPKDLINAVMATEDRRFFSHMGLDLRGFARAMLTNLRAGRVVQGGSTVTQQLSKVVFLNPERTVKRKVQEVILAVWLEYTFTKQEIMAMYLNRVYMGAGNYGVDAASQQYFGKSAADLSLYESAMLAGLLKAPSRYSPFNNPQASYERTHRVLLNMLDEGYIKKAQVDAQPKRLDDTKAALMHNKAKFFVDWVGSLIPEYVTVPDEGVKVITTLDPTLQAYAEESLVAHVDKFDGALVSATPKGEILAMVGGKDYTKSQFNRAAQAKRQPGSSFKLFVYLAAMEKGYRPSDHIIDEPVAVKDFNGWWSPQNYHNEYLGDITLEQAFAKSINTCAVKLSEDVGRSQVIEMARRLGITSQLLNTPSLPLGTNEITLLENVQAFAHMPNDGVMVRLHAVQEIITDDGVVIYKHQEQELPRVLDHNVVAKMNKLLMAVTQYGTAQTAKFGRPVGGKTGTTQEHRDAWFVGFTPQLVTGVWVGKDDNTSMGRTTGGTIPATIFRDYMSKAHENLPIEQLPDVAQDSPGINNGGEESAPALLRWFGFGSSKNKARNPREGFEQPSGQPMSPEMQQDPGARWQVPEGEELTPAWKQAPVPVQPVQQPGEQPIGQPTQQGDTPASMVPPEERMQQPREDKSDVEKVLNKLDPRQYLPKKMPKFELPDLF